MKVRPYQGQSQKGTIQGAQPEEAEERDEHGLTRWHYLRGRQNICGTCNQRPCADSCSEQWFADRLEWKATRAGLSIAAWATLHADWIAAHAGRPDVATWLQGQHGQSEDQPAAQQERRIPVEGAMAQAMAVVAGEARAEDMAPVYEDAEGKELSGPGVPCAQEKAGVQL